MSKVKLSALTIHPATPSRWGDIEMLFGERGACGNCWCMYLRLSARQFETGKKSGANKRGFRKLIESGGRPGVIAYDGREPIGWCAVAPHADYPRLARSRVMKPIDDQPAWSITCLFVTKGYRRRGVSARLIEAAVDFARSRGARIVEGYPVVATMEKTPDPFLWHGIPSAFVKAGFKVVAKPSKSRRIMRRHVRPRRSR